MRALTLVLLTSLCLAPVGAEARARRHGHAPRAQPVVVELFTAQGCGSCDPANAVLKRLSDRGDVIALTYSVDYWDYTGWTDTFAKPEFTERQQAYVDRLKLREIYTPEIVVDGQRETAALDGDKVDALISRAAKARRTQGGALAIRRKGRQVEVGARGGPGGPAAVWLVRYEPGAHSVRVKGDDRKMRTVTETNVVRELTRLGLWRGTAKRYALPPPAAEDLKSVVIVQGRDGGRILAAARL